jgi:hypothetical protein
MFAGVCTPPNQAHLRPLALISGQVPNGHDGDRQGSRTDVHLGPHDAAGAQTITDGPFGRIKGDDADAPLPGFVPRVASNHRCDRFSASQYV